MNDTLQQVLSATLDDLMTFSRNRTWPEEASAHLRLLQQQYPSTAIDLLWEEEEYGQSVHYDALLHLDGEGTVSLSFCPEHTLPWPMRGVHRSSEADLVRVNNTVLKIDQAISCLDFIWDEARIIDHLVNFCLVREALNKDPIEPSDAELQLAMDGFRRAHRLYKVEDVHRWMERHGMSHGKLERLVAGQVMIAKLRDRVTAGRVEAYFKEHQADFDSAYCARIDFPDEEGAHRTCKQIRTGVMDFYEAAQQRFLAAACSGRLSGEIFAVVLRQQASPELRTAVFNAIPGTVLGPIRTGEGYAVVRVLSFVPACLDERTHRAITDILFEEWLAERRQAATIEWYWGNASQTSQAG
jgi:putative peptide maturation system protein